MQDFLEHQLGLAVGIDGPLRQVLGHRHAVGRAVGGAGGAEDEFPDAALDGGIEQLEAIDHVIVEILFRIGHGFADERIGGEVHDGVRLGGFDRVENVAKLLRFAQNEFGAWVHRRAMAFGEIVIDCDLMAGVQQFFRANGADITGAAGDEDIHALTMKGACCGAKFKMAEINLRAPGKRPHGFDADDQPLSLNLSKRELHFLHDGIPLPANVRLHREVRHGGQFVRSHGDNDVGKFDLQSAGPRTDGEGGLGDFFTVQGFTPGKFGQVHPQFDIGGEKSGHTARSSKPRQIALIGRG